MLNIAVRAARNAGNSILRASEHTRHTQINNKNQYNFVTEVIHQSELEIIKVITLAFPDHTVLTEENQHHKNNEHTWIINPLNGVTNFLHGFPHYAVSIALKLKNRLEIGVIYLPLTNDLFTAVRGEGATLNDRRIRVTKQTNLTHALIGTDIHYKNPQQKSLATHLDVLKMMYSGSSSEVRRTGSTTTDLAWLAMGRLDGFWNLGLKSWDIAAGIIIVKEAGGIVTDLSFHDQCLESGNIIAGNPKIHRLIYQLINPGVTDNLK